MINGRYSNQYTVNVDNNFISNCNNNFYYTDDYKDTEVTVRYQSTDNQTSTKETKRNKED